jgi:CDP-diacylglycerol--serine O-phosphatidyltransferase
VAPLLFTDALGQASRLVVKKKAANSFGKAKTALITILITVTAMAQMGNLPFVKPRLLELFTFSCALLAFLSLYCKAIPDIWYANSLTLANFLCGLAAIWQIYIGHPMRGLILVFIGQFFDLFDGRLARKFGSTRYGAVFDDIADGTSFGFAIGFLIFHELGHDRFAAAAAIVYVVCVIYRLIRFMRPTVQLAPGIFQGMPSPAGAMLAGSTALLFSDVRWFGFASVAASALLMISSVRYLHFGRKIWPNLPNSMRLLSFVIFLSFANIGIADKDYSAAFTIFCFAVVLSYGVLGLDCLHLFREQSQTNDGPGRPADEPGDE